jgi:hypothetical protein
MVIHKLLTDTECRNGEQGLAVSFLGIHKSDFRYSVVKRKPCSARQRRLKSYRGKNPRRFGSVRVSADGSARAGECSEYRFEILYV